MHGTSISRCEPWCAQNTQSWTEKCFSDTWRSGGWCSGCPACSATLGVHVVREVQITHYRVASRRPCSFRDSFEAM